jgi:nucleoside triphosphate diphosphatase
MTLSKPRSQPPATTIDGLIHLMATLRDDEIGCPWDREQTFETIAPYTVEEAYEVDDAIRQADHAALKGELGDLLFQVVFHSRLAEEQRLFAFEDVVAELVTKMVRRHPHIFASGSPPDDSQAQTLNWEALKAAERSKSHQSAIDDLPAALPALLRAQKLTSRVARSGFDWGEIDKVWDKLSEEIDEVKDAARRGDRGAIEDEVGDMLFVCSNLARHLGVDAETALRRANAKFERRYRGVEEQMRLADLDPLGGPYELEILDQFWNIVKATEKGTQAAG